MRKSAWLLSMLVAILLGVSMLMAPPTSVNAIGEVTPTPVPDETDTEEEQEDVDVEALINEALTQLNDGEFRGAIATMDTAIEADPTNVFAHTIRAVANVQLGQLDNAIEDFSIAIELEPWQFDLYLFRGDAYAADGSLTDALLDYDQAIYITPLTAEPYERRSNLYYDLDDTVSGDVDGLLARGLGALNFGDSESAIAFFEEAIAAADDLPVAAQGHYLIGITNQINGNIDAAIAAYDEALAIDDQVHNAYLGRGILFREDGDIEAAGEDFSNRIRVHGIETIEEEMAIGDTIEVEMAYRRVVEITFEGEAGQEITISAQDTDSDSVDPLIALLDPAGNPIAGDDDFGGQLNSQIDNFELPENGTYTLLVSHAEGGYNVGFNGFIEVEIDN